MKTQLSPAVEVEYDFTLLYRDGMECPFKLNDVVPSPVADSTGVRHHPGIAYIVAGETNQDAPGRRVETLYVKSYRVVE